MKALSFLLLSLSLAGPGMSAETSAPTPPASAVDALEGQRLVGKALFRWFGLAVYHASLHAESDFGSASFERRRFALELAYQRAFDGADIAHRSIDEMQGIGPLPEAQATAWLDTMVRLFPNVAPGDRLLGLHEPGVGARFYFNGRLLGQVGDPDFSARFFGIWLSPRTSQPRLRAALIAGAPS